jgi:O-methyltransferase
MSAAMAETLHSRTTVLFDSFEGLPPPEGIDGPTAFNYANDVTARFYFDNCRATEEEARETMARTGSTFRIFSGWFDKTVPKYAAEGATIAVLRLDCDWYASMLVCLEQLFPRVVPGGLVIVDDYGWYDGCTRAVHHYLARTGATEVIRSTRSGVAYLSKR